MDSPLVYAVIPALDEEDSLPLVLRDLAAQAVPLSEVIVVDNGSTDRTAEVARIAGATVLVEAQRGYGAACLCALAHIAKIAPTDPNARSVVAFIDGDYSDYPEDLESLVAPIISGDADFTVGSRVVYRDARLAVPFPSRVGNWFATRVIRALHGVHFTDLGPFRAISLSALETLGMCDRSWGWTVEMQLRASKARLLVREVPVRYRERFSGQSKISGSLIGGLRAGVKILWILGKHTTFRGPQPARPS